MTFKEAVETTPDLENAYQNGLQALRAKDKQHINVKDTRKIRGSVDVDMALRQICPNDNRWDYAIAYKHTNRSEEVVYWLELHTASDSEFKVVIQKAEWLRNWLKDGGEKLAEFERDIVWISSGPTSLTLSAPKKRLMAQVGLQHRGSVLRIQDKRES
jgi:hypothetical protein